jgi:hypothetical protein
LPFVAVGASSAGEDVCVGGPGEEASSTEPDEYEEELEPEPEPELESHKEVESVEVVGGVEGGGRDLR